VTIELGKQFVRWGKTDILNPTDRFAPRDYLTVIDTEVLAVTAARLTVTSQSDSLDLVYTPRLTPSRMPLLDQRWTVVPEAAQGFSIIDGGADYPGGGQYGARWNHMGRYLEYSFSYFHGFNNLPLLQANFKPALGGITIRRSFAELDTVGADAAIPLRWLTIKAESAFFRSDNPQVDQYVLYVCKPSGSRASGCSLPATSVSTSLTTGTNSLSIRSGDWQRRLSDAHPGPSIHVKVWFSKQR
jgi:hypothetical protein